jgi:hypothetical protein
MVIVAVIAAGCQSKPSSQATRPDRTAGAATQSTGAAAPADLSEITQSDPCATRMHDIAGVMLLYYAVNRQLPEKLAELQPIADAPLDFTCPLSHLQYVYVPQGLRAEGKSKAIILHDAAASHAGTRWCMLMPNSLTQTSQSLEVVQLPESVFRLYH